MNLTNQIILSKILEYLKATNYPHKKCGKTLMLKCCYCLKEPMSCNKIPNTSLLNCLNPDCKIEPFTLIDLIKKVEEDKKNYTDDEILHYLKKLLKLDLTTQKDMDKVSETLDFYEKVGFDLVPVAVNRKNPIEVEWNKKSHKDRKEWEQWISNNLNIGIKTGQLSNITVLDLDTKKIPEELKPLLNLTPTLVQNTNKGFHFIYQYEEDLPKTRLNKYELDIENSNGQIVCVPSKVDGHTREWFKLIPPTKMPTKLKEFLLEQINKGKIVEINTEGEQSVTGSNPMPLVEEGGLGRSNVITKVTGLYRKQFTINDTKKIARTFNKYFINPPIPNEILEKTVFTSLDKYVDSDYQLLKNQILKCIQDVESTTKNELELIVSGNWQKGEAKKKINIALLELIREEKITKKGRNYEIIKEMEWSGDLDNIGIPIDFKMPYFSEIANFNWNDLILIGGDSGKGKTHCAINIIKGLLEQGVKPDYLFTEYSGRFKTIAQKLGLRSNQFISAPLYNPYDVIFHKEKHKVVIIDWLRPPNSEFNKMDSLVWDLIQKIFKVNGILIIFQQLKKFKNIVRGEEQLRYDWFAPNFANQFPSLALHFLHEDEEGIYGKFVPTKIRDAKPGAYVGMGIPTVFDKKTAELKLVGEE